MPVKAQLEHAIAVRYLVVFRSISAFVTGSTMVRSAPVMANPVLTTSAVTVSAPIPTTIPTPVLTATPAHKPTPVPAGLAQAPILKSAPPAINAMTPELAVQPQGFVPIRQRQTELLVLTATLARSATNVPTALATERMIPASIPPVARESVPAKDQEHILAAVEQSFAMPQREVQLQRFAMASTMIATVLWMRALMSAPPAPSAIPDVPTRAS